MKKMGTYTKEQTKEISFPVGGIGTGSIGLSGNGRLIDWEIFNRPSKGSSNGLSHFAVCAQREDGSVADARVLNGDLQKDFVGQFSKSQFTGYGFGPDVTTMAGYRHFKKCTFTGEFPVAKIDFSDDGFPGGVSLTAFNPLIPMDDFNSSIPGAFFTVTFTNTSAKPLTYSSVLALGNPFEKSLNKYFSENGISSIKLYSEGASEDEISYGDLTVATDCDTVSFQEYWYRGKWQDNLTTYWHQLCQGAPLPNRSYFESGSKDCCTLCGSVKLNPGESRQIRFVITWNIPNNHNYWNPVKDESGKDVTWKNYYATKFADSIASAKYSLEQWDELYEKTLLFKNALFGSTLPKEVIDAAASNLSVLKSPVVLRLEDGSFYGWEGVHEQAGSCEGTCQHVWNYAYALPYLFPNLERSIRDLEFKYNTFEDGEMRFRLPLPVGRTQEKFLPCVDGQMGTVIKCYREWKISGDDKWLKECWPNIKKVLEFAWAPTNKYKWDSEKDGVMKGRQHHTLDMELFSPNSWLEGFYLAALKAASEMADFLGEPEKSAEYRALFQKGYEWTKKNLFNGQYFIQSINLQDKSLIDRFGANDYWNEEAGEIKYQIGEGSAIDQMCAQWHANIVGLGDLYDKNDRLTALKAMYANNFKASVRQFDNAWRVFCLNDEGGAVICDYPKCAKKPIIPVPYCDETMTGFEYQLAGLMLSEGLTEEGLTLVKAVRDRYDGEKRNPWNEIECGSNYARSMASYALILLYSGFKADLPHSRIEFNPAVNVKPFNCFWSVEGAWGTIDITENTVNIHVLYGEIGLRRVTLPFITKAKRITADGAEILFTFEKGEISFEKIKIGKSLDIEY